MWSPSPISGHLWIYSICVVSGCEITSLPKSSNFLFHAEHGIWSTIEILEDHIHAVWDAEETEQRVRGYTFSSVPRGRSSLWPEGLHSDPNGQHSDLFTFKWENPDMGQKGQLMWGLISSRLQELSHDWKRGNQRDYGRNYGIQTKQKGLGLSSSPRNLRGDLTFPLVHQ